MIPRSNKNYKEKNSFTFLSRLILPLTIIMAIVLLFVSIKLLFFPASNNVEIVAKDEYVAENVQNTEPEKAVISNVTNEKTSKIEIPSDNKTGDNKNTNKLNIKEKQANGIILARPLVDVEKDKYKTNKKSPQIKKEEIKNEMNKTTQRVKEVIKKESNKADNRKDTQKRQSNIINNTNKKANVTAKTNTKMDKPKIKETQTETQKEEKKSSTMNEESLLTRWDIQIGGFSSEKTARNFLKKTKAKGHSAYINKGILNDEPFYKIRVIGDKDKKTAIKIQEKLKADGYPVYLIKISK